MSVQSEIDRIKSNVAGAYAAVSDMGGTLPAQQNSENLADAVRSIPPGGATPGTPLDPVEVYQNTRPTDWLPMPMPADNEIYLLFHIPSGVSSLLAFTVTCTGSYTVSLGTVADGQFVSQSETSVASGQKYETEIFAGDYGNLTSDGMKQVMVKVSGTNILTWEPSTHSKKSSPANFARWSVVDISCKLPSGKAVKCGNSTALKALNKLRYFSWSGANNVITAGYMFYNCNSLIAIPQLDISKADSTANMFHNCYALIAIPQLATSKVTNMSNMFHSCYSLTTIPQLDTSMVTGMTGVFDSCFSLIDVPQLATSKVTDMSNMFYSCYSLTTIPQLDTSMVTSTSGMFFNCYSLTKVSQLDTSRVTSMPNMFNGCYSLTALTLKPSVTGWSGYAISLSGCSLGHGAIVALFDSLPAITSSKALTLTGNPGVSELTSAEQAIATGKNWTLTL